MWAGDTARAFFLSVPVLAARGINAKSVGLVFGSVVLPFLGLIHIIPCALIRQAEGAVIEAMTSRAFRWVVLACLLLHFINLFCVRRARELTVLKSTLGRTQVDAAGAKAFVEGCLLCMFVGLVVAGYFRNYARSIESTELVVLLFGLVLGQAAACLKLRWKTLAEQNAFTEGVMLPLICGLLLCVVFRPADVLHLYQYHGKDRWSGIWGNPNVFGTFCAVGLLLSASLLLRYAVRDGRYDWSFVVRRRVLCVPAALACLAGISVFATGVLHSYSRGAWLGVAVGSAYVWIQVGRGLTSQSR